MKKYWVGSNGESPEKIFFNEIDAMRSGCAYVDVFDESGSLLVGKSLKLVDGVYKDDF